MFTDIHANDLSYQWMGTLFGGLFPDGAGVHSGTTVLGTLSGTLTTWMMAAGAIWMSATVLRMIVDSAYDGQILGRNVNKFWTPLRFVLGFSFLLPSVGGWSLAQHFIAFVVTLSISLANVVWTSVGEQVFVKATPLTSVRSPSTTKLLLSIAEMKTCALAIQRSLDRDGEPLMEVRSETFSDEKGARLIVFRMGPTDAAKRKVNLSEDVCGTLRLQIPPDGQHSLVERIVTAHFNAAVGALASPAFDRFADAIIASIPALAGADAKSTNLPLSDYTAIQTTYERLLGTAISEGLSQEVESAGRPLQQARQMIDGGWLWAGAYYHELAQRNAEFHAAVAAVPEATPSDWFQITTKFPDARFGFYQVRSSLEQVFKQMAPRMENDRSLYTVRLADGERDIRATVTIEPPSPPGAEDDSSIVTTLQKTADWAWKRVTQEPEPIVANLNKTRGVTEYIADFVQDITSMSGRLNGLNGNIFSASGDVFVANPIGLISSIGAKALASGSVAWTVGLLAGSVGQPFFLFGGLLFLLGVFLGIGIPLMPALYWLNGLIAWAIIVVEAIIIAPLWAFAHLNSGGTDPIGDVARRGYGILFNILVRPVLMLAGLIAGSVLFAGAASICLAFMNVAMETTDHALTESWFAVLSQFCIIVIDIVFLVIVAERCFSLIHVIPDNAPNWLPLGASGVRGDKDDATARQYMLMGAAFSQRTLVASGSAGAKGVKALKGLGKRLNGATPTARITDQSR